MPSRFRSGRLPFVPGVLHMEVKAPPLLISMVQVHVKHRQEHVDRLFGFRGQRVDIR